jgi:phosphocarrier protein FPr
MRQALCVSLLAPLSGVLVPLESVPDPVFAQKMVGDGISIDPTSSELLAPCDGTILHLHPAGHAVTVRHASGLEIMMHIGLDTVHLKGRGFTPRTGIGRQVKAGESLIVFDADVVGRQAKSLLTQILITNTDMTSSIKAAIGPRLEKQAPLLTVTLKDTPVETAASGKTSSTVVSPAIVIPNPSGIHARPAATLVGLAKRFSSTIRIRRGNESASARSVSSLMALDLRNGDKVCIEATGPDAQAAIDTLLPQIRDGLGEDFHEAPRAPGTNNGAETGASAASSVLASSNQVAREQATARPETGSAAQMAPNQTTATLTGAGKPALPLSPSRPAADPADQTDPVDPARLLGISAAPGLGLGTIFHLRVAAVTFPENGDNPAHERRRLMTALETARLQLSALRDKLARSGDPAKAAIFDAHLELVEDPDLLEIADSAILKGKSAPFSWRQAFSAHAERLAAMKNELLAARANDLRDIGRRVLNILTGNNTGPRETPARSIVISEELTPSDIVHLDRAKTIGVCTITGGATSHVAILARSLGLPALVGLNPKALQLPDGTPAIINGNEGWLKPSPTTVETAAIEKRITHLEERHRAEQGRAQEAAHTTDGHAVQVAANVGSPAEAETAAQQGAEGIGLLRSEFLFLERTTPPNEDEQTRIYAAVAKPFGKTRPVIIRTLDVGGDKPLPYLPIPKEDNPFLGERGIRVGLNRPELLRTQIRAILRASVDADIRLMFPMVSDPGEWLTAKAMVVEEAGRLSVAVPPVGIMIEVPAAALLAEVFAQTADFFSIGTNDLTQYTMAMDRGHPKLASQIDALHPAVLKLIALVVEGAKRHKRHVGVCGGLAGDPRGAPLLIGLGVDELSVSIPAIASIKAWVRARTKADCEELARRALLAGGAREVRNLLPLSDDL